MTRRPHARPIRPSPLDRLRWAVLSRVPFGWWPHLPQRWRGWWIEEYARRARHPR